MVTNVATVSRYDGEPKMPTYDVDPAHMHLLTNSGLVDYGNGHARRLRSTLDLEA